MKQETKDKLKNWMGYKAFQELDEISLKLGTLYTQKKIFPTSDNIFRAFELTQPENLKVVVLVQEPYNNTYKSRRTGEEKCYATGIALGNNPDVPKRSDELEVLIKGIVDNNYGICLDDSLEGWCKQGVLMLNASLTVEQSYPRSHFVLWENFTKTLLKEISERKTGGIYILIGERMGQYYNELNPFTSNIFTCESLGKAIREKRVWRNEQVFKQANAALWKINKETIKW